MAQVARRESFLIRMIAIYQRVLYKKHEWDTDLEARARAFIPLLSGPPDDLRTRVAFARLNLQWDLLMEENTDSPGVLELQALVFKLRDQNPTAHNFVQSDFNEAPMAKLSWAILAQAVADGASSIRITFENADRIDVSYEIGEEWANAMTIPRNLSRPLIGFFRRLNRIGYDEVRPVLTMSAKMPSSVTIDSLRENVVEIRVTP